MCDAWTSVPRAAPAAARGLSCLSAPGIVRVCECVSRVRRLMCPVYQQTGDGAARAAAAVQADQEADWSPAARSDKEEEVYGLVTDSSSKQAGSSEVTPGQLAIGEPCTEGGCDDKVLQRDEDEAKILDWQTEQQHLHSTLIRIAQQVSHTISSSRARCKILY